MPGQQHILAARAGVEVQPGRRGQFQILQGHIMGLKGLQSGLLLRCKPYPGPDFRLVQGCRLDARRAITCSDLRQ